MDIYYLDLKEPDLNSRVVTDLCAANVAERGATPGDGLRMEMNLVLLFAQLKVKHKAGLRPGPVPEQDKLFERHMKVPKQLAFMVPACLYARDLGAAVNRAFIMQRRDEFWRYTVLDC